MFKLSIVFSSLHSKMVDLFFITSKSICWLFFFSSLQSEMIDLFYHFQVNLLTVFSSPHSKIVDCHLVTSQSNCWLFTQFHDSQFVDCSFGYVTVKLLAFIHPSQSNCWLESTNCSQIFKSLPTDFSQLIVSFIISPSQIVGFTCFRSWRRRYSIHKRCPFCWEGAKGDGCGLDV